MRWKLFAIQNPGTHVKNTYGFNTTNSAPQLKELKMFVEDMFSLVKNIQFRPVYNAFQSELNQNIQKIHQTEDIIVKADKSINLYKMTAEDYEKLVQQNVTTEYKKAPNTKINKINKEAAEIARKLKHKTDDNK